MDQPRNCFALLAGALGLAACAQSVSLPDDGFVDVQGGRVAFRVLGGGPGIPLLVIHGGPGSSSCIYASSLQSLASERPVVIYDQLGSGYSDRMLDLEAHATVARFVSEVSAIREELGLGEIHLLGHSWGAVVALDYLLTTDPDGVRSVTFVGPLISTEIWLRDAEALLKTLPAEVQSAVTEAKSSGNYDSPEFRAADSTFLATYGRRSAWDPAVQADCKRRPPGNSGLYEYMWGPSEYVSTGTLQTYDRLNDLGQLRLPVLWLIGEFDEVRLETARVFQSRVPGSALEVLPNAGHVSNLDAPREFNAAISMFLRRVEDQ